jgi:hypothetical protein
VKSAKAVARPAIITIAALSASTVRVGRRAVIESTVRSLAGSTKDTAGGPGRAVAVFQEAA